MHKTISLTILALLLLGFAAERRLNLYQPRHNGVTTVRVMLDSWQYSEFMTPDKDLTRVVAAFEKRHPEIHIDLRIMPEANEITLMLPWRAKMTPFDLLLTTNNETVTRYADGGFLEPLDEVLKPELDEGLLKEFLPGYLQHCEGLDPHMKEAHLYGLPWLGEIMALNYRRDVLLESGFTDADVPKTYADLEKIARKLRDPEKKQYGLTLDLSTNFFTQNAYVPVLRSLKGTVVDAKGRLDVSSPEARKTFETLKRWYAEGLLPKGALTPYQSADDFRAKIAVFFPNWQSRGFWAIREMKDGGKHIGIGPAPDSTRVGALLAHYIGVIPKSSPGREGGRRGCCWRPSATTYKTASASQARWWSSTIPTTARKAKPRPPPPASPPSAPSSIPSTASRSGCSPCVPRWTRATASPTPSPGNESPTSSASSSRSTSTKTSPPRSRWGEPGRRSRSCTSRAVQ